MLLSKAHTSSLLRCLSRDLFGRSIRFSRFARPPYLRVRWPVGVRREEVIYAPPRPRATAGGRLHKVHTYGGGGARPHTHKERPPGIRRPLRVLLYVVTNRSRAAGPGATPRRAGRSPRRRQPRAERLARPWWEPQRRRARQGCCARGAQAPRSRPRTQHEGCRGSETH